MNPVAIERLSQAYAKKHVRSNAETGGRKRVNADRKRRGALLDEGICHSKIIYRTCKGEMQRIRLLPLLFVVTRH